jgi:hypothetical protein
MQPGGSVLWECSSPPEILPPLPQLCKNGGIFNRRKRGKSQEAKSGEWALWQTTEVLLMVNNPLVKQELWGVRCPDATARSCGPVHFYAVALKYHSSMRYWCLACQGEFYMNSALNIKGNCGQALDFALCLPRPLRSLWVWTCPFSHPCTAHIFCPGSLSNHCHVSVALFRTN